MGTMSFIPQAQHRASHPRVVVTPHAVQSFRPAIVASVGRPVVDMLCDQTADDAVPGFVDVSPTAWAGHGLTGAGGAQSRARVDEACIVLQAGRPDGFADALAAGIDLRHRECPALEEDDLAELSRRRDRPPRGPDIRGGAGDG